MKNINKFFLAFLIILIVVFLVFIVTVNVENYKEISSPVEERNLSISTTNFSSDSAFVKVSKEDLLSIIKQTDYSSNTIGLDQRAGDVLKTTESAVPSAQYGTDMDYSTTNVQVSGVDEGDIVKTNGKKIFVGKSNELIVVDATTVPIEESTKIQISDKDNYYYDQENIRSLLLDEKNNYLYLITEKYNFETKFDDSLLLPQRINLPITVVTTYNIKEDSLEKLNQIEIDGSYYQSRFKDDIVYILTTKNTFYFNNPITIKDLILRPIKETKKEETFYFESDMIMPKDQGIDNKNIYKITTLKYNSNNYSVIDSLDLLLDYSSTIYMSQNNLYVAYKKQSFRPYYRYPFNTENLDVFKEIYKKIYPLDIQSEISSNIEDSEKIILILNNYYNSLDSQNKEKLYQKIQSEVENYYRLKRKEYEITYINRINLKENGFLGDITTGQVNGNLLNQFSIDEKDQYLRVAITYNDEEYNSLNGVVVLDSDLKEHSSLLDLAKGERIYSVRFLKDKLFLVTFKQIDPFFVIDLKDHKNPEVLGYLKIPGYSNYLHPISDTLILGVGQSTKEAEWGGVVNSGVKVSLFDVSDYNDPKEVSTYNVFSENSQSPIQNDHKAFLYVSKENLVVIPVFDYYYTENSNKINFYVLEIKENELLEKTIILHNSKNSYSSLLRSLYIGDELYTISDELIKTYNFESAKETEKIIWFFFYINFIYSF